MIEKVSQLAENGNVPLSRKHLSPERDVMTNQQVALDPEHPACDLKVFTLKIPDRE